MGVQQNRPWAADSGVFKASFERYNERGSTGLAESISFLKSPEQMDLEFCEHDAKAQPGDRCCLYVPLFKAVLSGEMEHNG